MSEDRPSVIKFVQNVTYNASEEDIAHDYLYHNRKIIEHLYKYYIPPMLLFCLASIFINIRVLISAYWIRRPLSPTLYISLSLAASDACTSALLGIGLLLNSYLPVVYEIKIPSCMVLITIEMYRLSGVIITVVHLLALSINHYLGILKPLRYLSIMTTKKITITVVLLWVIPIAFMKIYFFVAAEEDFWTDGCKTESFLSEVKFRLVFSSLFFIPLTIMGFCYTHILFLVRKQQEIWAQLSRSGSTRYRGIRTRHGVDCSQRQLEGNVKAIYTTLLILGSCVIGWLPAVMIYILICPKGCFYDGEELERARFYNIELSFYIAWVTNLLIILKTLVNPIIYSCRMVEIKESTRRMHAAFNQTWRASQRTEERFLSESQRSQNNFGGGGGGSGRAATALCRMNGNGSNRSQLGHAELANTLV